MTDTLLVQALARSNYDGYLKTGASNVNPMTPWADLTDEQRAPWLKQAAAQMEKAPVVEALTPLDRDIVDLLQEEGAETVMEIVPLLFDMVMAIARVQKTSSKAQRFGNAKNPFAAGDVKPNFELLEDEIGDMMAIAAILASRGVISKARIDARIEWKVGMLKTHGSIDWTKADLPEDEVAVAPEVKFGAYVDKAPYQEMRLRQAMTGVNAPAEADWVEALRRLNEFVRHSPQALAELIGNHGRERYGRPDQPWRFFSQDEQEVLLSYATFILGLIESKGVEQENS